MTRIRKRYLCGFVLFFFAILAALFLVPLNEWIAAFLEKLGGDQAVEAMGGTEVELEFVVTEEATGNPIQGAILKIKKCSFVNEGWDCEWEDYFQLTTGNDGRAITHQNWPTSWTQTVNSSRKNLRLDFPLWGIHIAAVGYESKFTDTQKLGWDFGADFEKEMKIRPQKFLIQLGKKR